MLAWYLRWWSCVSWPLRNMERLERFNISRWCLPFTWGVGGIRPFFFRNAPHFYRMWFVVHFGRFIRIENEYLFNWDYAHFLEQSKSWASPVFNFSTSFFMGDFCVNHDSSLSFYFFSLFWEHTALSLRFRRLICFLAQRPDLELPRFRCWTVRCMRARMLLALSVELPTGGQGSLSTFFLHSFFLGCDGWTVHTTVASRNVVMPQAHVNSASLIQYVSQ